MSEQQEVLQTEETDTSPKKETHKPKAPKKGDKEICELNKKIEELSAALAERNDSYLRLCAEYDNFRKRSAKEKTDSYSNALAKAAGELLPVIDNFERAVSALPDGADQGFSMIYTQFCEYIDKMGITEMQAQGQKFDPTRHVAVMHIEDEALGEGQVVEVFQKGYLLGDKVIRPACVKVAN